MADAVESVLRSLKRILKNNCCGEYSVPRSYRKIFSQIRDKMGQSYPKKSKSPIHREGGPECRKSAADIAKIVGADDDDIGASVLH